MFTLKVLWDVKYKWRQRGAEAETPILWPLVQRTDLLERPRCWERLKAGGKGDDRGWDGWLASPTQWTWIWASSGRWWWTGRPGVLQPWGRRVGHNWANELNWRRCGSRGGEVGWGDPLSCPEHLPSPGPRFSSEVSAALSHSMSCLPWLPVWHTRTVSYH